MKRMDILKELIEEAKKKEEREERTKKEEPLKKEEVEPVKVEEKKGDIVIEAYNNIKIVHRPGEPLLLYLVPILSPTERERKIINIVKDAVLRVVSLVETKIRDPVARRNYYKQRVLEIMESFPQLGIPSHKKEMYAEIIVREMVGYGLIDPLVTDDRLEEIMVIGPKKPVYVFHRKYGMLKTNITFSTDEEIRDIIDKIAREVGRRIDMQNPLLDARLPDGSRVNATIPPASVDGSTITIRKFRKDPFTVLDLIAFGTMNTEIAAFLWLAVDGMGAKPANILIAGGTGSGKTTTLNVLASFIPATERVITIEDTAELNLPLDHWVRLEARPPGIEGTGEISMDVLVKNSLRMRPDRIIVGEVRHAEAFSLFTAMNTGHDGCMGTIHSNSAEDTMVRITSPPMNVPHIMATALDLVVVQHRIHDRRKGTIRRITEIAEVRKVDNKPKVEILYTWDAASDNMIQTSSSINYLNEVKALTGLEVSDIEDEIMRRADFLTSLKKKGVKGLQNVKKEVQAYYEESRKRWKKK